MLRLIGTRASLAHVQHKVDAILGEPFFVKYISGKERVLLVREGCPLVREVKIFIRIRLVGFNLLRYMYLPSL